MASVNISGLELLDALEKQLEHMLDCEQLIYDLYDDPGKPLEQNYGSGSRSEMSQWDKDKLQSAINFVKKYRPEGVVAPAQPPFKRPMEAFLNELPRLRDAARAVTDVSYVLRYRLPEVPREEQIKMWNEGKRTLNQRLDTLSKFDDSE